MRKVIEKRKSYLAFKELMQVDEGDMYQGWAEYVMYGGLPLTVTIKKGERRIN